MNTFNSAYGSKRTDNPVTLKHEDAKRVADMLSDLASSSTAHARKTRSAAVRDSCELTARDARRIAEYISSKMWTWS